MKFYPLKLCFVRGERLVRLIWKERRGEPNYGRFATAGELEQLMATDDSAGPPLDVADLEGSFGTCSAPTPVKISTSCISRENHVENVERIVD